MFNEFKKFAMQGNVVDLAVGVVIGAAFGAIVNSVVQDVVMPIIGLVTGGLDFSQRFVLLQGRTPLRARTPRSLRPRRPGATTLELRPVPERRAELPDCRVCAVPGRQGNELARGRAARSGALRRRSRPSTEVLLLTEIRDLLKVGARS